MANPASALMDYADTAQPFGGKNAAMSAFDDIDTVLAKVRPMVPGGRGHLLGLTDELGLLNNAVGDAISGKGQYKIPQRLALALGGAYMLGDEDDPLSAAGAIGGYGAGMGLEAAGSKIRSSELDDIISSAKQHGSLVDIDENTIAKKIDEIISAAKNNDPRAGVNGLRELSFYMDQGPGASGLSSPVPNTVRTTAVNRMKLLTDPGRLERVRTAATAKIRELAKVDPQGAKLLAGKVEDSLRLNTNYADDMAKVLRLSGLDLADAKDVLNKSTSYHELLEGLYGSANPVNAKGMAGGGFPLSSATELGMYGVGANHNSSGVLLREMNLAKRIHNPDQLGLLSSIRAGTGERDFLNKILDTNVDDVIFSEKFINENAANIDDILASYVKGQAPSKALLDKVKMNKVVSMLGRGGSSVANFEQGLKNLVRKLLRR